MDENQEANFEEKGFQLFLPHAFERVTEAKRRNIRFSHYTSAYAALQIIEKNAVWMRNAVLMNDFSEVQHGQRCLAAAWRDDKIGGRLRHLLETLQTGLSARVADAFDKRANDRGVQSYLVAISEHGSDSIDEDRYGRLSMWRAYGGDTNVAFVFNNKPFFSDSNPLNAFTSPVLYKNEDGFKENFLSLIEGLEANRDFLNEMGADQVLRHLTNALNFAALSTKHPAFAEEREWRVIYSPTIYPSDKIPFNIETVSGVPQRVYKLNFKNYPDEGFVGASLPELLEEIIIGPTSYPWPIYDAIATKLEEAGVADPWNKVRISNIPLRR